ncbi:MAG: methionyl-tRNA formyltransferase [Bacillota bacterium]|jgi:methionyl-tRNA formyltransferase
MRIVYMGSPDFAVPSLEALLAAGYQVVGVVTQPDRKKGRGNKLAATPVKEMALKYNIPIIQPQDVNEAASVQTVSAWNPDIIIVVAFGQLLKKDLLNLAPFGAINVHASLLPSYRGAAPIHWAVIKGEKVTGVTTMYMNEGMDTGDMILKAQCTIEDDDNAGILHDRLAALGAILLLRTLDDIKSGQVKRFVQDQALASYAPMLQKEDEVIDWHKKALDVHNQIRGLSPCPGAYTFYHNKRLKIYKSAYIPWIKGLPGRVLAIDKNNGLIVAATEGAVALLEVQPEGKAKMSFSDFSRGYAIRTGDILG